MSVNVPTFLAIIMNKSENHLKFIYAKKQSTISNNVECELQHIHKVVGAAHSASINARLKLDLLTREYNLADARLLKVILLVSRGFD